MATDSTSLRDAMAAARDQHAVSLLNRSREKPTLVVFLRHAGCPFCAEAIADVSKQRAAIESRSVNIVFICQWPDGQALHLFENAGIADLPRIHDPNCSLYNAFGLRRGNLWQIAGPFVWFRVLQAAIAGHRVGRVLGDAFQMPGTFLIRDGEIIHRYKHRSQASRPDYLRIANQQSR